FSADCLLDLAPGVLPVHAGPGDGPADRAGGKRRRAHRGTGDFEQAMKPFRYVVLGLMLIGLLGARPWSVYAHDGHDHESLAGEAVEEVEHAVEHEFEAWEHVVDTHIWHIIDTGHVEVHLWKLGPFQITKFMILELIAA